MTDDYQGDLHGPHDHPVIATLAGCAVLIAGAVAAPHLLPAQPQAILLGAGAAAGFVLWLAGFTVTTRLSNFGWIAGSLAILLGAGTLAGYLTHRQYEASVRQDPSSFADLAFSPAGAPILPRDVEARGPISRLFAASVQADGNERREFDAAMAKLGMGNLNSPYLLTQNPQTIAQCGELESVKALANGQAAKRAERKQAIGQAIDSATLDASLKQAIRAIAAPAGGDALQANQLAGIDATAQLCALLAKRGWYNDNGYFGFNSGGDAVRYKALQARRAALASEGEKLDKDAVTRIKAEQEKVQAALS
ncbi:MAG: hypothetical protein EOP61_09870 [Sphingomonadales bacterium]|nr:MAG: hypothetical protein EOP61_09870 [Sphingomonadales bacterium]